MIPLPFLALLRRLPWRMIGYGVAAVAVVWLVWSRINAYGDRRYYAGEAAVQALWEAQVAEATRVAQEAETARITSEAADAARNEEIAREHARKTAALVADNSRLERLLRNALAPRPAPGGGSNPEVAGISGTAETGPQGGDGQAAAETGSLAADIAAALTEARANAEQLDALIAEIKPQL